MSKKEMCKDVKILKVRKFKKKIAKKLDINIKNIALRLNKSSIFTNIAIKSKIDAERIIKCNDLLMKKALKIKKSKKIKAFQLITNTITIYLVKNKRIK